MMLSYCSFFFLTVFFLPFFLIVSSSPIHILHKLQFLLGIPVPVWATHGMQHLLWQSSLPHASSSCISLHIPLSPHVSSPHAPEEFGTALTGPFPIEEKLPPRKKNGQKVCPPATHAPGLSAQSYPPLQDHASIQNAMLEREKPETCFIGSDHQAQSIRSLPHHLPTKDLQLLDLFNAETVEKTIFTDWVMLSLSSLFISLPYIPSRNSGCSWSSRWLCPPVQLPWVGVCLHKPKLF